MGRTKNNEECWTKSSGGKPYIVCEGSKGQKGVYKADNPRGPQNPERTAREQEEKERAIAKRDRYREENTTQYGKYPDPVPAGAPSTDAMRDQLIKGGARESSVEGMGKRYIYKRWIKETKKGEEFAKQDRPPKERKKTERPSRKGKGIKAKPVEEGGGRLEEHKFYLWNKGLGTGMHSMSAREIRARSVLERLRERRAEGSPLTSLTAELGIEKAKAELRKAIKHTEKVREKWQAADTKKEQRKKGKKVAREAAMRGEQLRKATTEERRKEILESSFRSARMEREWARERQAALERERVGREAKEKEAEARRGGRAQARKDLTELLLAEEQRRGTATQGGRLLRPEEFRMGTRR